MQIYRADPGHLLAIRYLTVELDTRNISGYVTAQASQQQTRPQQEQQKGHLEKIILILTKHNVCIQILFGLTDVIDAWS